MVERMIRGAYQESILPADEHTWAFIGSSCDGCATKQQVSDVGRHSRRNRQKFCCGLAADRPVSGRRPANGSVRLQLIDHHQR
jgi:hypothetical protein